MSQRKGESREEYLARQREYLRRYREANREVLAEQQRRYYEANREAVKDRSRRYQEVNREAIAERKRLYYGANREAVAEQKRRHYEANREAARARNHVRRARKRAAGGSWTAADVAAKFEFQGGRCFYCTLPLGDDFHRDHFVPLAKGGSNAATNLVLSCAPCNLSKNAKLPSQVVSARPVVRQVAA